MNEGVTDTRGLADWSPDALFVIDPGGRITYANHACEDILGWPVDLLLGRGVLEFAHPDDAMLVLSSVDSVLDKAIGRPIEVRARSAEGSWRWLEVIGRSRIDDPGIGGIVCTARDLTQRRMWEVASGDVTRFQQVVQHSSAVVMLLDAAGVVTSLNRALTRLLGYDPSVVVGQPLSRFAEPGHERTVVGAIADAILDRTGAAEVPMRTADGRPPIPIRLEIVNLLDDPVVGGLVATGHDISELHEAKRHLEHLVNHDPLTGLPNRVLLDTSLERMLATRRKLAVLYIDLDGFKPVNDAHGHDAGDRLLVHVARRLAGEIGTGDLVARVGGDEFVVVALDVADRGDAAGIALRLSSVLGAPFDIDGRIVRVSASVGVAVATNGSQAASLVAEADQAMYAAKAAATIDLAG